MTQVLILTSLSLIAVIGSAQAAESFSVEPTPTPTSSQRFACFFEGRGQNDGNHQGDELRCRVRGLIPVLTEETMANSSAVPEFPAFELECSNRFRLRTSYPVVTFNNGAFWINAKDDGHLATILWKLNVPGANDNRQNARLITANLSAHSLEGKCWLENSAPPALE